MTARVMSVRSALGVASVSAALGLGLVPFVDAPALAATKASAGTYASATATTLRTATFVPLRRGATGVNVRFVQRTLGVKATGYYGTRTVLAVKSFQRAKKLRVTGVVDLKTWGALKRKAALAASRARTATVSDPTMTAAAAGSRTARNAVTFAVWQTSAHGRMIVRRESGGRCTAVSPGGLYRGKWQMGSPFWRSYGGLTFASTPDRATCLEQDKVAYRGWLAAWWRPWGG